MVTVVLAVYGSIRIEPSFAVGLDYQDFVTVDKALLRPAEADHLFGNTTKAWTQMGWKPKVSFEELSRMMVEADLEKGKRQIAKR